MTLDAADSTRARPFIIGLALVAVLATVDAASDSVVLMPLLVVGPLVAAIDGAPVATLVVGLVAVVAVVPLGFANDLGGTTRHLVAVLVNAIGTGLAFSLARARATRDTALVQARPALDRAARLTAAMNAGQVGEWEWQLIDGRVLWDETTSALFGAEPGEFEGTFDDWIRRVDERDRDDVRRAVAESMRTGRAFRFDHRCVWRDGSVHWIEGVGEPVHDTDGRTSGAVGLVFDVDERYRELGERNRLVEVERAARLRAEYLALVQSVLTTSLDVGEIAERVADAAVPELGDWCAVVVSVDRPPPTPLIAAAHADPSMRAWAQEHQAQVPYDPDVDWGAAKVIRTGRREIMTGLGDALPSLTPARSVLDHADVDAVLTVPIRGQLGVLGALQLVRGRRREAFSRGELELIEEVADRCGAALNNAVLFGRQAASRAALDTLQRVSGGLARAVTRLDVAAAVIDHGLEGLRATGAAVFVSEGEQLELVRSTGVVGDTMHDALHDVAGRTLEELLTVTTSAVGDEEFTVGSTALQLMGRITGVLTFVFRGTRHFTPEELSLLVTLGSRCAGALERASLYEGERETALVLQRRLLPAVTAVPSWLEVSARYEPSAGRQIGGDWFELQRLGDDRAVAVVGDAVGHGVASAAAMGQLRASLATAVASDLDPVTTLELVDRFAARGRDTIAASVVLAVLDRGGVRIASAGHPPIVVVRADGEATVVEGGRRPLLGLADGAHDVAAAKLDLAVGDLVVMFTDGLVEHRRRTIDEGTAQLIEIVVTERTRPLAELCDLVIERMRCEESDDDVALLVLRRVADYAESSSVLDATDE